MNSLSRNAGGLFESVRRLHQSLAEIPGLNINVYGMCDEFTEEDIAEWKPVDVHAYSITGPRAFGYAPALRRQLLAAGDDILHVHGLWQYPSVVAPAWHRKCCGPYVISPHGMLDPWAVGNSAWKKRLAMLIYERKNLEHAACIRALCESEANSIRALGLKMPISIIPNGVDLPVQGNAETLKTETLKSDGARAPWADTIEPGRKVLLYLGRIHPKKGLVNLLKAWSSIQNSKFKIQNPEEWTLVVAGWDQGGHEAELKRLATELGIRWADRNAQSAEHRANNASPLPLGSSRPISLLFTGPLFGPDKDSAYSNCDAFILPSVSEGLPMVVLEAWAYGKPVLMTPECNLPEGFTANAAIRIETNVESIALGLNDFFRLPPSALRNLGTNGRALVAARFTWPMIAADMKSVYDWVLGGGAKPTCVI